MELVSFVLAVIAVCFVAYISVVVIITYVIWNFDNGTEAVQVILGDTYIFMTAMSIIYLLTGSPWLMAFAIIRLCMLHTINWSEFHSRFKEIKDE